jgi:hypothetical protein
VRVALIERESALLWADVAEVDSVASYREAVNTWSLLLSLTGRGGRYWRACWILMRVDCQSVRVSGM